MRRSMFAYLIGLALLVFNSMALAGQCDQIVAVKSPDSVPYSDQWEYGCYSTHREIYDPYGPNESPFAKFYQFTLERDADISIDLNTSPWDASFFLIKGSDKYAVPEYSHQRGKLKTRLDAGTYIIEIARSNTHFGSFELAIEYNDVGRSECEQSISSGIEISDGWVPGCQTTSRDVSDPYNTIPGEGHRVKYFTFNLMQDTDININVNSDVDSYLYLLQGTGESAVPFPIEHNEIQRDGGFDKENVSVSLRAGYYTIELTTKARYAPGQFTIELNAFSGNSDCLQQLVLGDAVSGTWSANCEIQSWIDGDGNPYQGDSPERANYYTFTLEDTTAIRFSLLNNNDPSTIMNIYAVGDYFNKLATTKSHYWQSNKNEVIATLEAGTYHLEMTKNDRVAIGNYSFTTYAYDNSCIINLELNQSQTSFLTPTCLSQFRINDGDGIDDPYGVQVGEKYYAKRFEFSLNQPANIRFNANTGSQYGYLYLAKEVDGKLVRLTETYPEHSWQATRSPSLYRELDEGRYIVEVTTKYPEREASVSASLHNAVYEPCATYLPLNVRRSAGLGNRSNCRSEFKESSYNYDPYGPNNGFQHFYAKSYTFQITQAGNYQITGLADRLAPHLYLTKGGDLKGRLLLDRAGRYGKNEFLKWLEPGIYTLEYTSTSISRRSNYSILVWDGASEITDENKGDNTSCINAVELKNGSQQFNGQWSNGCDSVHRIGSYAQYIEFELTNSAELIASLQSSDDNYMFLLKWNGVIWAKVGENDDTNNTDAQINDVLSRGKYRLEATTYSAGVTGDFNISVQVAMIVNDSDNDGRADDADAFPNDPGEWLDTDLDGIGNNADLDDDNDGIYDYLDASPLNSDVSVGLYRLGDIYFSVNQIEVNEKNSIATIKIERIEAEVIQLSSAPVGVFYFTLDGSAEAGVDYMPVAGQLIFQPGETSKEIAVPLYDNALSDGNRSFDIMLSHPNVNESFVLNLPFSKGRKAEVIIKDDEAVSLQEEFFIESIEATVAEASSEALLTVKRRGNTSKENRRIYYHTVDGTAKSGSDYKVQSGLLEFSPNENEKQIRISIINDSLIEAAEYFDLKLSSAEVDINLAARNTRITISDDDIAPESGAFFFTLNEMTINENMEYLTLAVERRGGSTGDVTVNWQTKESSAKSGQDYVNSSGELKFKEGQTHKAINIHLLNDDELGLLDKSFQVILSDATAGAVIAETTFTVTVLDDDMPPKQGILHFSSSEFRGFENSRIKIAINRILGNQGELKGIVRDNVAIVNLESGTVEAEGGAPDSAPLNQTLTFTDTEITKYVPLYILDDSKFEGTEYLGVELLSFNDQFNSTSISQVEIIDDEAIPEQGVFRFSKALYIAGAKSSEVEIIVERLYGSKGNATLYIEQINGTAKSEVNYHLQTDAVYFADGETSKSIVVSIVQESRGSDVLDFSLQLIPDGQEVTLSSANTKVQIMKRKSKKNDGFLGLGSTTFGFLVLLSLMVVRARKPKAII